jgi:hypothetical protein
MKKTFLATVLAAAALPFALPATAAIAIVDGTPYTQDFDTLTTSTTASAWAQNSTLPGWYLFVSTLADAPTIAADAGGSNAGTFRSYGAAGASERALGSLASGGSYFGSPASGAPAGYIAAAFSNAGATPFDGFTVAFDGEQWRNGGNTAAQSLVLSYGLGASFGTVAWSAPVALFGSPVIGSTAGAVDGNSTGLVAGLGAVVTGLDWAPGQTLWLRWTDLNDIGNDHGLAIDNLSFTASVVPEPGALALMLAGLGCVGFIARRRA